METRIESIVKSIRGPSGKVEPLEVFRASQTLLDAAIAGVDLTPFESLVTKSLRAWEKFFCSDLFYLDPDDREEWGPEICRNLLAILLIHWENTRAKEKLRKFLAKHKMIQSEGLVVTSKKIAGHRDVSFLVTEISQNLSKDLSSPKVLEDRKWGILDNIRRFSLSIPLSCRKNNLDLVLEAFKGCQLPENTNESLIKNFFDCREQLMTLMMESGEKISFDE